jgi:hypothetical protein
MRSALIPELATMVGGSEEAAMPLNGWGGLLSREEGHVVFSAVARANAAKAATAARASAERRMRIVSRVEVCPHGESQRGFSDRHEHDERDT